MKRLIFVCFMLTLQALGNPVNITNDWKYIFIGDSFYAPGAGQRFTVTIGSYGINMFPQHFVSWRDFSSSGLNNNDFNNPVFSKYGIPSVGSCYGKTNITVWTLTSGNGSLSSNTIRGDVLVMAQFPTNSYNPSGSLTNDWTQLHSLSLYETVVSGDPPYYSSDGNKTYTYGDGGKTSVSVSTNMYFMDVFRVLSNPVVGYAGGYPANSNLFIQGQNPRDHVGNWIEGAWALEGLTYPTNNQQGLGADTNVFTMILDANTASVSSTGHCVVSNLSGNSSGVSFTVLCDRMAPGMWHPGIGPTTNDMTGCTNLIPALANAFCEIMRITNLVSGNYRVTWDVTNSYTRTANQLANGDNLFMNFSNPLAHQKMTILYDMCVMMDCSPTNQSDLLHPGDNRLVIRYKSAADGVWADSTSVDQYISTMAPRETELEVQDIVIHNHAQQVPHNITVELVGAYQPAPFR